MVLSKMPQDSNSERTTDVSFIDVFAMFLDLGTLQLHCCLRVRKLLDFIKNILIYVPKMNEGLMGL